LQNSIFFFSPVVALVQKTCEIQATPFLQNKIAQQPKIFGLKALSETGNLVKRQRGWSSFVFSKNHCTQSHTN